MVWNSNEIYSRRYWNTEHTDVVCRPPDFHTLWKNGTSYSRNPLGQTDPPTEPRGPHPATPRHSSPRKHPTRGLRTTPPDKWGIHNPHALPRDQIYGMLKNHLHNRTRHTTGDTGKTTPTPSLDSPMGLPAHTKAHTAAHTPHPHSTCRTQNYVYTVNI